MITVAGTPLNVLSVSVEQTKKASEGGSFRASVPLALMEASGLDLDWLATAGDVDVSVTFTVDGEDTQMFSGKLDMATVDFSDRGELVSLRGRDKSSTMKDTKTNEKFVNQKSEDIASQVASRHGLTLQTDGGTKTAGKIYTEEQAKVTGNQSEWTLLRQLAEAEGKALALLPGDVLYFKKADDDSLSPYVVTYLRGSGPPSSNAVTIKVSRNFQAAQTTTVTTNSWDHKKQQLVTSTKTSQSVASGSASETVASAQAYVYNHHHMTQEQADAHADSKLTEHTRHEFDLTVTLPGDVTLTPVRLLRLTGTQSSFDQDYNVDHVTHDVGAHGYRTTVSTKCASKRRSRS